MSAGYRCSKNFLHDMILTLDNLIYVFLNQIYLINIIHYFLANYKTMITDL